MVAPCPYTLCCFRFGNGEWGFFPAFWMFLWLRRLPSRSKEKRTWTVTRRRQIYLHSLEKVFQRTRSCPKISHHFSTGTLGWHHWQCPAATSSARKGAPFTHGDATQNPSGFSYGELWGHLILKTSTGSILCFHLPVMWTTDPFCTTKMRWPRYWMLPIMFEMRTERLLGIQWNPPLSHLHSTWTKAKSYHMISSSHTGYFVLCSCTLVDFLSKIKSSLQ